MPDISFQGTPEWYGGSSGVLRESVDESRRLRQLPYSPYTPPAGTSRIAPFSPLQQESFDLARRTAQPVPQYGQAQNTIQNSLNRNIYGEVQPYLQRATTAPGEDEINQFMNPYQQQVVENIGRLGSRNLIENILPNIQNRFISSGQYGSTGHQNLTNRAIRDTQEGISQSQAQALQGGYNTALQSALGQQERQLQAGQIAGTTAGREADRQLVGAEALQNLAGAEQTHGLRGVGILSQLGGQQQQQEQNAANVAHQNFVEQRNFPYRQAAFFNEMIRGLPVNSQLYGSNVQSTPPMAPQASPYTQAGGLLAGISGAMNQRQGYAHGGEVKKLSHHRHYADGGSLSPIQQGANAAIDTAELKDMRDQAQRLSRPQVDPFWSSIARAGFNIAANRQPGVLAKLGEAGNAGLDEYHSQLAHQDNRGLQSAKIMNLIDNTRRLQHERNRSHELEREKFSQHQKEFGMHHAIQQGHLGLAREKLAQEKELYEQGLKGSKSTNSSLRKSPKDQKDIEEAKKQWEAIQKNAPELNSLLSQLEEANEKVKTPGWESAIGDISESLGNSIKNIRAGKTNVNDLDVLGKRLANVKISQLTGKQSTVAHQKSIMETKANPKYTYETNKRTINLDKEEAPRVQGESDFGLRMLEKYKDPETGHYMITPGIIKLAYNNFWKEKDAWEKKHAHKEFPYDAEDFLNKELGEESTKSSEGLSEEEYPDERLMKIAGIE